MGTSRTLSLTSLSRQLYRRAVSRVTNEVNGRDLEKSAIVFSPHPDDETLGCGGTIIKKKRAGADVKIVFMTDGGKSHTGLISEKELKAIRAKEGLAASRSLGLNGCDVFFLEFEENTLSERLNSATERVAEILQQQQPNQVFIPYYKEPLLWSEDHLATNRVVLSALQLLQSRITIYEYPIWFWRQWPWVSVPIAMRRETWNILKDSLAAGLGMRLLKDFRCSVFIGDVLESKRTALDQHKSQMTRLIPDPRWLTLSDVSNGEFLACFFQEHEIFRRYSFP
jgi:LmbE family N-acetylglucosaminyl deacetylase